ncbi:MAG: 2-amino-4-hydroxy-6-hydroxymethyldihydropteridine diphosphokinase [Gemmatimonadetes bacterium]|nr:2-amino-4-hydroxy-6-hydroxymethyldihydropteridine diphosphokinase [Gemmatimonadota bacterium]
MIIGLGTNLEPRETALRRAATELKSLLDDPVFSDVYETRPMYDPAQPRFLNACAGGWTLLGPPELLGALKALEAAAGRRPGGRRYGPRELDLDLLLYGDEIVDSDELRIPHPRLAERPFVLVPMVEIAGGWSHPELRATIDELLERVGTDGVEATNLHLE